MARPAEPVTRYVHLLGENLFWVLAMQRHADDVASYQQQKFDAERILQNSSAWHKSATAKYS